MSGIRLYGFQREALERTKGRNRVAFFHEMGLGKTFTGSEKAMSFDDDILLICQKSKINDWFRHFNEHYRDLIICNMTTRQFKKDGGIEGAYKLKEAGFGRIVFIINYELAWRRKELLQLHDFTLMLDESSLIQNHKAKQSKFVLKLNFKNVILLSGTPCSGKYENLWTQAHLLGWDISEQLYNSQYVNYETIQIGYGYNAQFHKVVDRNDPYKNVERLKRKLREHGADFLKTEECFDLPEQTFIDIKVDRPEEYEEFLTKSIVTMDDGTEFVGNTTLTKHLYLREICGIYSQEKLEAFENLLESTNDRLIVFYSFNEELGWLIEICEELGKPISQVNGHIKNLEAYEYASDSVTLVQYQAGAKGLNLQKANKVIFYSPTERCEDYMQALKRIHRINQHRACFYYRMMCSDSIEERIYNALERGADYTDHLFKEDFET